MWFIVKRIVGKIFLLCFSLFVSSILLFGLLECFPSLIHPLHLDVLPYFQFRWSYVPDTNLIFRYKPNFKFVGQFVGDLYSPAYGISVPPQRYEATFDSNGFRTDSLAHADVVALGDSFLEFGLNESDTFSKRLEKRTGLRVSNLGLAWYGPYQYIHLLERYGIRQKPKYALFCFFEGNDIDDIEEYLKWQQGGAYHNWDQFSKNFFQRYLIAIHQSVYYARLRIYERKHSEEYPRKLVALSLNGKVYESKFNYMNDGRSDAELLKTWDWIHLREILGKFKELCVRNSIVPVVVFIPSKEHIYTQYSSQNSGINWLNIRDQQIRSAPNREMAMIRLCEDLQITLVDLVPWFDSLAKKGNLLYYPFDTHWNSEGRESAAAYIAGKLVELNKK